MNWLATGSSWPWAELSTVRPVTTASSSGGRSKPVLSRLTTQWAAVMTTVGATSEPPQNWRCEAFPWKRAGESVKATCQGACEMSTGVPPTIRGSSLAAVFGDGPPGPPSTLSAVAFCRKMPSPTARVVAAEATGASASTATSAASAHAGAAKRRATE